MPDHATPRVIRKLAVIGCGTIGASWAARFLAAGLDVAASDPAPDAEARLRAFVARVWPDLESLGLTGGRTLDAAQAALRFAPDVAGACAGADMVQENAPERLEIKRDVLARIESAVPESALIASSTSGIMPSVLQEEMNHPGRFLVAHPFNPPHLVPLVELVPGRLTDPASVDRAEAFYRGIGKRPIRVRREVPGHVANRLQAALWREAVHLAAEGVASVADIDTAVAAGPGLRWALMGPHLTFHLAGGSGGFAHFLEHLGPATASWWADLGDPQLTPEVKKLLSEGIAEAWPAPADEVAAERDARLLKILRAVESLS